MIVSVALSPSVDVTYLVDDFTEGSQQRPLSVHRVAGGKAINMARAAATLGASVTVLAVLGGTSGAFIRTELEAASIPIRVVDGHHDTRTCVSVSSRSSRLLTEIYERPTPINTDTWDALLSELRAVLATHPAWVSFSGGLPESLDPTALGELVRVAGVTGTLVAIDSHGAALEGALTASPALVKVNRAEAEALLDATPGADLLGVARGIREVTRGNVVITDGKAGSVGVGDDGAFLVKAADDLSGDFPVGSGDSYLGGMLTAFDSGASLADAMRLGTAAAVANALVPGAGVIEPVSVTAILPRVSISRLD